MASGAQTTLRCALALSGTLVAGGACAAQWSAEPAFSFGGDMDSNRRLAAEGETTHSARFTADLALARETETQKILFRPRLDARRYDSADAALNSNDLGADLQYLVTGERSSWQFLANAREDSTLTSELADTGIVEGQTSRRTLSGGLNSAWKTGERSELQFGANWLDVDFEDALGTGLTPYRYPGAYIGFARETGDRSRLTLSANAARLEVPSTGTRVDNYSVEARWRARITERLSLEFTGGVNRVENPLDSDQGAVFSVSGEWSNPRSALSLTVARDVEPSGLGRLMEVDSVSGGWRWQMAEHLHINLTLRHQRRTDLLFGFFPERREYSTAQAALQWQLDPQWNLELRAGGARQAYELLDFDADGGRVEMVVSWAPRRFTLAR